MITTPGTKVRYIAAHAENFGGGSYTDLRFDTPDEAQTEIDNRHIGIKKGEPYFEYWTNVRENMKVYKVVEEITPYEDA